MLGASNETQSDASAEMRGQDNTLLLGVPIAAGPNVTTFMYVNVDGNTSRSRDGGGFEAEAAAAKLCSELYKDEETPSDCLATLAIALASR